MNDNRPTTDADDLARAVREHDDRYGWSLETPKALQLRLPAFKHVPND